jgi:putative oxidoreductase
MYHIDVPANAIASVHILVRAVLAVAFLFEFKIKVSNIKAFVKNDDVPLPLAWFIAMAELAAALSFISGILTQLAALGVMLLMMITISMHIFKWHSPYKAGRGGWEYDLLLFTLAAVLFTI